MLGKQSLLTGGAKVRNQFSSALLYGSPWFPRCNLFYEVLKLSPLFHILISIFLDFKM